MFDIFIETEAPGFNRHIARIMPVRNVDIMILQQRFRRVAQQGGKMARHGRDEQNLGLRAIRILLEMDQAGERRCQDGLIRDANELVADRDVVDHISGAFMGGARIAEHIERRGHVAQHDAVRLGRASRFSTACCYAAPSFATDPKRPPGLGRGRKSSSIP